MSKKLKKNYLFFPEPSSFPNVSRYPGVIWFPRRPRIEGRGDHRDSPGFLVHGPGYMICIYTFLSRWTRLWRYYVCFAFYNLISTSDIVFFLPLQAYYRETRIRRRKRFRCKSLFILDTALPTLFYPNLNISIFIGRPTCVHPEFIYAYIHGLIYMLIYASDTIRLSRTRYVLTFILPVGGGKTNIDIARRSLTVANIYLFFHFVLRFIYYTW